MRKRIFLFYVWADWLSARVTKVKRHPPGEHTSCRIPSRIIPHFSTSFYSFHALYLLSRFFRIPFLSLCPSLRTSRNQSSSHWTPLKKKASRLARQFSTLKKAFLNSTEKKNKREKERERNCKSQKPLFTSWLSYNISYTRTISR